MKISLIFILISSCSVFVVQEKLRNTLREFRFEDTSGEYIYLKKRKFIKDEMITRVSLKVNKNEQDLERTTSVTKIKNRDQSNVVLLPRIAEHKVWFSKKLYYSKIEAVPENKTYRVTMKSPESKWNGVKEFKVPKSKRLCWYSQLAECMKLLKLLDYSDKKKVFVILWDSYPYHTEQLKGVTDENLFVAASIKFNDNFNGLKRYEVEIGSSNMVYFYTAKKEFQKAFWISQGISLKSKD